VACHELHGWLIGLLTSYLSDCSHAFRANGKDSKPIRVNCSVPPGLSSRVGRVHFVHRRRHGHIRASPHWLPLVRWRQTMNYKSVAPSEVDLARACMSASLCCWCASMVPVSSPAAKLIHPSYKSSGWGRSHTPQKISTSNLTLEIGDGVVQPASVVLVDQELTFKQHIAKIASSCFYCSSDVWSKSDGTSTTMWWPRTLQPSWPAVWTTATESLPPFLNRRLLQSRRCMTCSRSQTVRPHNPGTSSTALATGRLSCAVQTVYINAHNH